MKKILIIVSVLLTVFYACHKEEEPLTYEQQLAVDTLKIEAYLERNDLLDKAMSTASGLYYIIDSVGTGYYPTVDSTVKVIYTGKTLDDVVFDSGTVNAALSRFILGWQEGIPKFKEGGSGKLYIPSGLGYGTTPVSTIPANSVLIFDIELVSVY